jgi:hypothetical protein
MDLRGLRGADHPLLKIGATFPSPDIQLIHGKPPFLHSSRLRDI